MKLLVTALSLCALALRGDPTEVGFGKLAGFDYAEGMTLPADVTALDQKSVKISGFMRRENGGDGATDSFMLVYDACGCVGMPKLNEVVFCTMPSGETTDIKAGVATITGTLYVGEDTDGGVVLSIYTLDVDTVSG